MQPSLFAFSFSTNCFQIPENDLETEAFFFLTDSKSSDLSSEALLELLPESGKAISSAVISILPSYETEQFKMKKIYMRNILYNFFWELFEVSGKKICPIIDWSELRENNLLK